MLLRPFEENREFFQQAATNAAHELGVFEVLDGAELSAEEVTASLGVSRHRLRALFDVLCAEGAISRSRDAAFTVGSVPDLCDLPRSGWGLLAEAIRSDRPQSSEQSLEDYHDSLRELSDPVGHRLAQFLSQFGSSLLDLGCGAGHFVAAFLSHVPGAVATAADVPAVMSLTRPRLQRFGERIELIEGDARSLAVAPTHDIALLSQILHWHGSAGCRAIIGTACDGVRPGGAVAVVEVDVSGDRSGPMAALYFSLNLALYSREGSVHDVDQLRDWMGQGSLENVETVRPDWAPGLVVVTGRKR